MSAVDFEAWATPDLELTLGGRTYSVRPPSVDAAKKIIAAAVRGEVNLGLVEAKEVPAEVQRILDTIEPDEHPGLGDVYDQLAAAKVAQPTIDRMAYYAVFYWARGKEYADTLAKLLWLPREEGISAPAADASPKG